MKLVREVPAQLWVTALKPEIAGLVRDARLFHVKHGTIRR
jgi:hypothetical protein